MYKGFHLAPLGSFLQLSNKLNGIVISTNSSYGSVIKQLYIVPLIMNLEYLLICRMKNACISKGNQEISSSSP